MKSTTVERGEVVLSQLLRVGVLLSALVILFGVALLFATQPQTGYFRQGLAGLTAYPPLEGGAPVDRTVGEVAAGLRVGEPDAVISLGLLSLIATPIVRVAASVLLFLAQRDYRYVVITLFVLTVLLTSLVTGVAE
jgi:uncharacterized membrane protein